METEQDFILVYCGGCDEEYTLCEEKTDFMRCPICLGEVETC